MARRLRKYSEGAISAVKKSVSRAEVNDTGSYQLEQDEAYELRQLRCAPELDAAEFEEHFSLHQDL